jgi:uncharacterized protein YbjT (DUF2867 family)
VLVLVTGGTGSLGREVVPRLVARDHTVRVMSRRARDAGDGVTFVQADMVLGEGLASAMTGVDAIAHLASDALKPGSDLDGTRKLVDAAKVAAPTACFFYVSIVGVDRMRSLTYYREKHDCELAVEGAGLPYTILRETQFHPLLDERFLPMFRKAGVLFLPKAAKFQLLDVGEAADHVVAAIEGGPKGRLPDVGGPEILDLGTIAAAWMNARGKRHPVIPLPCLGPLANLKRGDNTCPIRVGGKITWAQYLAKKYGPA